MPAINTNVAALFAQQSLKVNERNQSNAMRQLSTGSRVNTAGDDAAGMAIGQSMTTQVRGLNQAVRNLNDGVNMMQTAEGALSESSNMLQRMRELAVQASNGTYSVSQRGYLDTEFQALSAQIEKVSTQTKWNDTQLLGVTATNFVFQAGKDNLQTITATINDMSIVGLTVTAAISVATVAGSALAITALDLAIGTVNTQRASIGASINQMTYAVDNLSNVSANASASRSSIMDTDYAAASTQLSKTQIIQQAATAMLAQANQQPQAVLSLLK